MSEKNSYKIMGKAILEFDEEMFAEDSDYIPVKLETKITTEIHMIDEDEIESEFYNYVVKFVYFGYSSDYYSLVTEVVVFDRIDEWAVD